MSVEHTLRDTYDTVFGGERNMSMMERGVSVGLGLIMAAGGVNRADVPGAIMGLAGAALVARGMSGHCPIKSAMGYDDHDRIAHGRHGGSDAMAESRNMQAHAM